MLQAADCFHGVDAGAEQAALIRAFEFTLPAERLAEGATLAELGRRLREGAALQDGLPATILTALGAFIVLPYDEAVPLMRRAVDELSALPPAELMNYAVVGVALTTALWDAVARRTLLDRVAAAARDAGASRCSTRRCGSCRWPSSRAAPRGPPGEHIAQVRELRRAIGYDAEQVVNGAYLAWSGAPRAQVEAISDAALAMGFGGRPLRGHRRPRRARPGRGPLPRRVHAAQAADRRAVPPGHPAGARRLRRGRGAGRARRRGRAARAAPRGAGGGQRVAMGPGDGGSVPGPA